MPQTACGCQQIGAATAACPDEVVHRTDFFITSHSEKNYHLAYHAPFTLTIWTGQSNAYGHAHTAHKFPPPNAMKFHLMNDAKMITAHLQTI
jgi:hypothetical protein